VVKNPGEGMRDWLRTSNVERSTLNFQSDFWLRATEVAAPAEVIRVNRCDLWLKIPANAIGFERSTLTLNVQLSK
jgi:hypothetical protein